MHDTFLHESPTASPRSSSSDVEMQDVLDTVLGAPEKLKVDIKQVAPGISLGPLTACENIDILSEKNITHVCCISTRDERAPDSGDILENVEYSCFEVKHWLDQRIVHTLPKLVDYIHSVRSKTHGHVLISCHDGFSHCSAVAIAYIMSTFKITYSEAYKSVQESVSDIDISHHYRRQLEMYMTVKSPPSRKIRSKRHLSIDMSETDQPFRHHPKLRKTQQV